MHINKFQVQLGQIFDVHTEIFGISYKTVYISVFLCVQIRGCDMSKDVFKCIA